MGTHGDSSNDDFASKQGKVSMFFIPLLPVEKRLLCCESSKRHKPHDVPSKDGETQTNLKGMRILNGHTSVVNCWLTKNGHTSVINCWLTKKLVVCGES